MNHSYRVIFLAPVLYLFSSPSHAEGGCPSGMIPYRGTDINSCAPIPSGHYQNEASQSHRPQWATRWGAIALDEGATNVGLGVSTNTKSSGHAKNIALADCKAKGGTDCKIQIAYKNQCATVIAGIHYTRSQGASTIHEAENVGLKACRDANIDGCSVYYSACSLPQRIQ